MIHVQCSLYICWFKSSKKTIYHIWCVTTRNQILCRVVYPLISLLPRMEGHVASSNSVVQHSAIGPCTPMPASQNRALTPRPLSLLEKCILPSVFYRGTRQSNILPSAALGKIKHSAKVALPPGSRQKVAGPWRLPPAVRFCWEPNGWHSAIFIFFSKTYFAECQPQTLGIFFKYFAECQR